MKRPRPTPTWRAPFSIAVAATMLLTTGCHRHAAGAADCDAILDRLVDLELTESGFRDPILRARWQRDLRARYAADLARCRGLTVPDDLATCLTAAPSPEGITHHCLE
jgi:hypothetical protein